ncbi:MAG: NAD(P)H-dependent oxidoreductase [Verrucomicrobia bacterium]|nr:NAD(P)H-dependent oxidoreductase [Verrucomicrobiota bacterium]
MVETPIHVLAVIGSLNHASLTRTVILDVARQLEAVGCTVDVLDCQKEQISLFNPDTSYKSPEYAPLKERVDRADVLILGTPDYHGCMSSTMKSFLDHFWHEFAGKLFATIVASREKGLTVTDQLRTVARQCYAWSLPYGVSFIENEDVKEGEIVSDSLEKRLEMMVRDVAVYGKVLAAQRRADLGGEGPGFLARYRQAAS